MLVDYRLENMRPAAAFVYREMPSPIGRLKLMANDHGLVAVLWTDDDPRRVRLNATPESTTHPILSHAQSQLEEYFDGERTRFDIPLDFIGTPFQQAVWRAMCDIPFGETCTYADLARRINRPTAVRAVGAANRCNPIAIIGPCHRIIGSNGELTGYAGGLEIKAFLLAFESRSGAGSHEPD